MVMASGLSFPAAAMRILIRTSKWAIWARRLGSLALPVTIVPVFLHREQMIASGDFVVTEAVAAGLAALAVFLALGAFARLWVTGDRGWGRAASGLLFGIACLLPFAWLGYQAVRYPMANEVTVAPTSAALRDRMAEAFPNARTRSYPVDATAMFPTVDNLVPERGWDVRIQRAPPTALDTGQINAIAMTLFGWRDEVAIRVAGTAQGSTIDMRSVPLGGFHDFGENGRRIEEFLLALDQKITLTLRDAPQAPAAGETEPPPAPPDEGDAGQ